MSQRYDNTKNPKPKENQPRDLGILLENLADGLGPRRESCWGYVFMRIHPKSCCISPLKAATTLLSGSCKGAVGV